MKVTVLFTLLVCSVNIYAQDFIGGSSQNFNLSIPVVADFDGDSLVDVLGVSYAANPNKVVLQLNNGSSSIGFTEKVLNLNVDAIDQPVAVDIDGDGDLDVIVAAGANLTLMLLRNDGAANFTAESMGISGSDLVKVADFDNDNDLDIVGINTINNTVDLYVNDGAQVYSTIPILSTTDDLEVFDVADMDGDMDVDIVLGFDQFNGKQIVLYKNNGNNSFEEVVVVSNDFYFLSDLVVDDINSDGKKDIIAVRSFNCSGFINQGGLAFTQQSLISASGLIISVVTGDYNGDGRRDVLLGKNSTNLTWHKNLSNDLLTFEDRNLGSVAPAYAIVNADLDEDGDEDIVVSNGSFWWYENVIVQEPSGILNFPEISVTVSPNPFSDVVRIGDIGQGSYSVNVVDPFGRSVYFSKTIPSTIDLSALNTGTYFLTLTNNNTKQSRTTAIVKGE